MSCRLVSTVLTACAVIALAGCGTGEQPPTDPGPPGVSAPESLEPMLDTQEQMLAEASRQRGRPTAEPAG